MPLPGTKQFLKVCLPINSNPFGSSNRVSAGLSASRMYSILLQPLNTDPDSFPSPRIFRVSGRITPVRPVQPLKANFPMVVSLVADRSSSPVRQVHYMAAWYWISVRLVAWVKSNRDRLKPPSPSLLVTAPALCFPEV